MLQGMYVISASWKEIQITAAFRK